MSYEHINSNGIALDCWWSPDRHALLVYENYPALSSIYKDWLLLIACNIVFECMMCVCV